MKTTKLSKDDCGCGKEFMWINYLNDKRICGKIEDLKHSDHIILCPQCQALKEQMEGVIGLIKRGQENCDCKMFIGGSGELCPQCKDEQELIKELKGKEKEE